MKPEKKRILKREGVKQIQGRVSNTKCVTKKIKH